jgi:hypothetical protein
MFNGLLIFSIGFLLLSRLMSVRKLEPIKNGSLNYKFLQTKIKR